MLENTEVINLEKKLRDGNIKNEVLKSKNEGKKIKNKIL